jgi:hypothetical protein
MNMHPTPDFQLPVTHIAATSDGEFVKLYANGLLIGTAPSGGGTVEWYIPTPLTVGVVAEHDDIYVVGYHIPVVGG